MKLPNNTPSLRSFELSHDSFGKCTILVKRPSYEAQLRDQGYIFARIANPGLAPSIFAKQKEEQIKECVVGWEGVYDADDNKVIYSYERLQQYCLYFPALIDKITDVIGLAYQGMTEEEAKN